MLFSGKEDQLLYALEQYNVLLLPPPVGSGSLFQFLSRIEGKITLLVSDDFRLTKFFAAMVYQKSIYDDRFTLNGSPVWLTCAVVLFLLRNSPEKLYDFDFIIIDGVDDGSFKSQVLLSMIGKFNSKLIIPLKCTLRADSLEKYFKDYGSTVITIDLIEQYPVSTYYQIQQPTPNKILEITTVLNKIFEMDRSQQYDILVLTSDADLPSDLPLMSLKSPVSTILDVSKYKVATETARRVIFHNNASDFFEVPHNNVKYIVDVGDVVKLQFDELNDSAYVSNAGVPDKTTIVQSIALLSTTKNSKYFGLFNESEVKELEESPSPDGNLSALLLLLLDTKKLHDVKFIKKPAEHSIRKALNQLVYMGLITIMNNEPTLTDLAKRILKFQFDYTLSNLNLFASLIYSISYNCGNELLKIVSIMQSLNWAKLSKYLKEYKSENDFLTMIQVFDEIITITNGQIKSDKHTFKFNAFFQTQDKRQVLSTYKQLQSTLEAPLNQEADHMAVLKCLVTAYQFQTGSLTVDLESNCQIISPIFHTTSNKIKISLMDTLASPNDLLIFHCGKVMNTVAKTAAQSHDATLSLLGQYAEFKGKIPKKIAYDLKLSLFKWRWSRRSWN